jgi:hypothetical protein
MQLGLAGNRHPAKPRRRDAAGNDAASLDALYGFLNDGAAAAGFLKRVQQALVAGHAHDSLPAAHGFLRVRQNPVAATACYDLRGALFCIFHGHFSFHIRSLPAYVGYRLWTELNQHSCHLGRKLQLFNF